MSEPDPNDPAAPGPRRPRKGHFDPKEEIPFADDESAATFFGRPREDGRGADKPSSRPPGSPSDDEEEEGNDDDYDFADRWDADDPRRQKDQMAPPAEPCECYCLHCGRTYMSDLIWFQRVIGSRDGFDGFWMCPTPNCGGAGFTFDIFPTDPAHPANAGWVYTDDEEGEWDEETGDFLLDEEAAEKEYDPDETKYKQLDEIWGDVDDDDLEGEEWKYGLQPGERPETPMSESARMEREEEERRYNSPDERPRELDWTNREEETRRPPRGESASGSWEDDDIPF